MKKDVPLISQLLKAIILEDYASAIEVITNVNFDPNETNSSWNAPVLTAIINIVSNSEKINDITNFKEILKEIVKNDKFDPNVIDIEGETVLMHIARHPDFNWLVPFIINTGKVNLSIKNFMHNDVIDIAEKTGNSIMADILIPIKANNNFKGMPKKRKGIKKIVKETTVTVSGKNGYNILDRIELAFEPHQKKNPVSLYNLLVSFFKGEYDTCIQIVRDANFNPNECDKWEEPALSSLMYYSQDVNVEYDVKMFKNIASIIIENKKFNVNALDSDCNTVLMVAMGFPKLKWLAEMLFNLESARLDVINDSRETIRQIAENCGNGDFYNHLVMKTYEEAVVVE